MCWSNIKWKNTFFILTNVSVVLHNLLQFVWVKDITKSLHTQQKLKLIKWNNKIEENIKMTLSKNHLENKQIYKNCKLIKVLRQ